MAREVYALTPLCPYCFEKLKPTWTPTKNDPIIVGHSYDIRCRCGEKCYPKFMVYEEVLHA